MSIKASQLARIPSGGPKVTLAKPIETLFEVSIASAPINQSGSGVKDFTYAINSLVNKFRYAKTGAYRILKSGEGLFGHMCKVKDSDSLFLYGIRQIVKVLDAFCGEYFIEISAEKLVGNGKNRVSRQRSWLLTTFYKRRET